MANPYVSQTISGYNTSPPPDDGSQVSANQLKWSNHKTKLADPIKTLSEAINTAVNTAFATVDDASNLTTGELPDARLSSNVPLKTTDNVFSGTQEIEHANPQLYFDASGAGLNERIWRIVSLGADGSWTLATRTDANGSGQNAISLTRTGTNVDEIALTADSITANSSEVLTPAEVAAATAIEGNALVGSDGFYVDDAGVAKRMSYQSAGLRVQTISGTSDTLTDSDMNSYLITTNASAVTITLNTGVGVQGNVLLIKQGGAGQVTVSGTATLESSVGTKTRVQNSVIALVNEGSDVWSVSGDGST